MAAAQFKSQIEPSVPSHEDADLVKRHLQGDQTASAAIMNTYSNPVYGYLTRCGVPASERDDLFQDVFCKVFRGLSSFETGRPLKPWLFTIVANTTRTYFRRGLAKRQTPVLVKDGPPDVNGHGPDAELEAQETAQWLEHELARLPLVQREVVVLCSIEQMSHQQAASALQIPVNTVKTQLRRARIEMAKALARRRLQQEREGSR